MAEYRVIKKVYASSIPEAIRNESAGEVIIVELFDKEGGGQLLQPLGFQHVGR